MSGRSFAQRPFTSPSDQPLALHLSEGPHLAEPVMSAKARSNQGWFSYAAKGGCRKIQPFPSGSVNMA